MADAKLSSFTSLSDVTPATDYAVILRESSPGNFVNRKATVTQLFAPHVAASDPHAQYFKKAGDTVSGGIDFSGTAVAGLRIKNLTTTQRNALTPLRGQLIYNTTLEAFEWYNGTVWVSYNNPKDTAYDARRDFGVKGDGTTNDSTALKTAMDTAAADGKALYLPAGTYIVNNTGTATTGSLVMYGDPGLTIIKRTAATGSGFLNIQYPNVYIKGVTFDMNKAAVTADQWGVFFAISDQNVFLEKCVFKNNSGTLGCGLALINSAGVTSGGSVNIINCEITGNTWNALYIGTKRNVRIVNNDIHDNTGTGLRVGAYLTASSTNYSTNVLISGNRMINNYLGSGIGGFGAPYNFSVNPPVINTRIEHNHYEDNYVNTTLQGHYLDFMNNSILQTSSSVSMNAAIFANMEHGSIKFNRIKTITATWGIDKGGSYDIATHGNDITMNAGNCLNVGGTKDCTVYQNNVLASAATGSVFACTVLNMEGDGAGTPFPTVCSNLRIFKNEFFMDGAASRGLGLFDNAGGYPGCLPTQFTDNNFRTTNSASGFYAIDATATGAALYINGNSLNGTKTTFVNPNGANDIVYDQWATDIQTFTGSTTNIRSIITQFQSTYGAATSILYVTPSNGGSGYTAATVLTANGTTGGSGWTGTANIIGGVIVGVRTLTKGTGYTGTITVTASDTGGGTGAVFTVTTFPAQLANREITISSSSVDNIILGGGGYVGLNPNAPVYMPANNGRYKLRSRGSNGWSIGPENGMWPSIAIGSLPTPSATLSGAFVNVTGAPSGKWLARCNATHWVWSDGTLVSGGVEPYTFTLSNVDLMTTAQTLMTQGTLSGRKFYPTKAVFRVNSKTGGAVTTAPIISVGNNASTYDNICSATPLTGMDTADEVLELNIPSIPSMVSVASTALSVNVTAGAGPTTLRGDVWIQGLLL